MSNRRTHKLNIAKSNNSIPVWATNFSDLSPGALLTKDVEQTYTVPGGVTLAIVRYTPGASVFVSNGDDPIVVPVGPFVPYTGMLSPTSFWCQPGDTLRFLATGSNAYVNINFFDNDGI